MHISRINIGRVYNLGNYEHVRYDLTVDISVGESAATAIRAVDNLINALKPDRSIKSVDDLKRGEAEIVRMRNFTEEEWTQHHRYSVGSREEITQRYIESLEEYKKRREESIARQKRARELFDDLGGASQWKDAKENWGDDY